MDLTKLCTNYSACRVEPLILMDAQGADVVTAVAKLTWHVPVGGAPRYAIPQRPIRHADAMVSTDNFSSVLYPSDRVADKPGTDVILVGNAHPENDSERSHDVHLRVEGAHTISKIVRVHGLRVFQKGARGIMAGPSVEVGVTPLVYELAAGGFDYDGGRVVMDDNNPAGRGVALDEAKLIGAPAFVLESLTGSEPAGFAALGPHFLQRRKYAGTYDDSWQKTRAPLPPLDFDPRHNRVAHPDLQSDEPLAGDEPVEVLGATPDHAWRFKLPAYEPSFEYEIDDEERPLETHLDTFLIDAEHRVVELTWRATVRLPRKVERLKRIVVREATPLPSDIEERAVADMRAYRKSQPS